MLATALIGPGIKPGYDPDQFVLPEEAEVLVVVEGNEDRTCLVTAYEKSDGSWKSVFAVNGNTGQNGMSKNRVEGDMTTPVGVWLMNTPFGQKPAQEGFPSNYLNVTDRSYVWTKDSNDLVYDPEGRLDGERIGSDYYSVCYDYVINSGYNANKVSNKGSAIFIHCQGMQAGTSAGCIKIPEENMIELMKLYGKHGDGKCFIAVGITGEIDKLYDKYGTNNGLEAQY